MAGRGGIRYEVIIFPGMKEVFISVDMTMGARCRYLFGMVFRIKQLFAIAAEFNGDKTVGKPAFHVADLSRILRKDKHQEGEYGQCFFQFWLFWAGE